MLKTIDISTSGLVAQRQRMNAIAGNIANVNTTRDAEGNAVPFQRRLVTFRTAGETERETGGTAVDYHVEIDTATPPRRVYQPGHPDADADGYVNYPNVSLITEFVNALEAGRAYEANIAAIEMAKNIAELSLRILA
ncbi:MAG: flagellar basal body rod protein FlgC [Planctomycetes bacterium]|nr:flagellar basal body rod protein FlgC [Planctomycetota bacterium]